MSIYYQKSTVLTLTTWVFETISLSTSIKFFFPYSFSLIPLNKPTLTEICSKVSQFYPARLAIEMEMRKLIPLVLNSFI